MTVWLPDEDSQLFENPELFREVISRYRRVLDGDGYAFWEWGLHNNTYKCGGSFWKKLGYTEEMDKVNTVDTAQVYIHPDDFNYVNTTILEHLRYNTPINMVYRIKGADGTYWWTQASASSTRDDNGRVTYITGVTFDLSHLKETEKALRLSEARHERVLSASNDGIWEWSAVDANENPKKAGRAGKFHTSYSCWKPLGYSEEEVDALPEIERLEIWKSHIHPDDIFILNRALRRYFVNRKPVDIEYRMFGDKGKMIWMRSRGQGTFNTFGRLIVFSGVNIDMTQMKESEDKVRQAKEVAERANRSKSHFLSSMSHELRTPLNAIIGFSELLAAGKNLTHHEMENVSYIHDAGKHLLQLINDVLDLAQVEEGKLNLSMELILPGILIRDCFNYFKPTASKRNIKLLFDPSAMESVYISVDATRLRQCLLNLVSNGIKYNKDFGEVQVRLLADDEGQLQIVVSDTGQGIPEDKQSHLFEVFNRLGAEGSTVEGSGIGLAVTKQITEAMGGTLTYAQAETGGACFTLTFPIAEGQPSGYVPKVAVPEVGGSDLRIKGKRNLIYIEDNLANIRLLDAWLKPYPQLHLDAEPDPLVGLYKIRSQQPDMVLLDIHLPEFDGIEILQLLKASGKTRHIPVIALSASAMVEDIEKAKAQGFDEYLTKPLDIKKLLALINLLFGKEAAA